MDRTSFDISLLRTAVGSISAQAPGGSQKFALALAAAGLDAENDERLTRVERTALEEAIDVFQRKITDAALLRSKVSDEDQNLGIWHLALLCKECSNVRILENCEQILPEVLKRMGGGAPQTTLLWMNVIATIFRRLKRLHEMPTVRSKITPLGAQIIQRMEKLISNDVKEDVFVFCLDVAGIVVQAVGSSTRAVNVLMKESFSRIQSPCSSDACRLAASRFIAINASRKGTQQWSQTMAVLIQFLKRLTDILWSPFEEESPSWNDELFATNCEFSLQMEDLTSESILSIVKVFAGGMDLLERLITTPEGHYPVPLQHVLNLLIRVVSLSFGHLRQRIGTPKSFEFLACLPNLQVMCWNMISVLVTITGDSCLCHSRELTCLFIQSLSDRDKPPSVKQALFEAAIVYIRGLGFDPSSKMFSAVWEAVKFETRHITEAGHEGSGKAIEGRSKQSLNKSKKRKKMSVENLAADVEMFLFEHQKQSNCHSADTLETPQASALELMATVFRAELYAVPQDVRMECEEEMARLCLSIVNSPRSICVRTTLAAFKTLLHSVLYSPDPCRLMPVAVYIYNKASNGADQSIRYFCQEALRRLNTIRDRSWLWNQSNHKHLGNDTIDRVSFFPPILPSNRDSREESDHEDDKAVVSSEMQDEVTVEVESQEQHRLDEEAPILSDLMGNADDQPLIPVSDAPNTRSNAADEEQKSEQVPLSTSKIETAAVASPNKSAMTDSDSEGPLPDLSSGDSDSNVAA